MDQSDKTAAPVTRGYPWSAFAIFVFWLVVIGLLYLVATQVLKPKPATITATGDLVIPKARDGHYYAEGTVGGKPVLFMVDTGASMVTVSEAFARTAGLDAGVATTFQTANGPLQGRTIAGVPVTVGPFRVSGVRVGVGLVGGDPEQALLGQSFLGKFDILLAGDKMTLRAKQP
ncbi:MAG: clan AA aspartic protease [Rhodoferax sp.]|nr:clan AA aspartic protease [Rhodoferax sp.]